MPSGEIANSQLSSKFIEGLINLKYAMYRKVKINPTNIPEIAPSLLMDFEKIPKNNAGKIVAAARPNANATTCATNPGG
jgi:hypothetical protein